VPSAEQVDNRRRVEVRTGSPSLRGTQLGVRPSARGADVRCLVIARQAPQMLSRKTRYPSEADVPWPIVVNRMDAQ
jgi:hypothetical protein